MVLETFDHLQRLSGENRADYLGISTGYGDLDRTITGLNKSDLILVAARPGMGKTAFALNIAANVALRGKKTVAIFSLEMSREQLMNRLFASEGGIDSRRLLTGELSTEDWGKVADLSPLFGAAPLYMDDTAGITVAEMKAKLRRVRNLGLVVIDYLQLMSTGRRSDNRVQGGLRDYPEPENYGQGAECTGHHAVAAFPWSGKPQRPPPHAVRSA